LLSQDEPYLSSHLELVQDGIYYIKTLVALRHPALDQLGIIHRYQPRDTEPLTADEICLVEFTAANNLVNRSRSRWHPTALPELVDLIPGVNLMLDHDWDDVAKNQGLIISAWLIRDVTAPIELIEAAGNGKYNRKIIEAEGYQSIHFDAAIRVNSPLMDSLRYCEVQNISQGGFEYKDIWCPLCDCSYHDPECPHFLPSYWDDGDPKYTMPYYERKDVTDLGEISLVTIPNLPCMRVVS
jgi:hypothetical protein